MANDEPGKARDRAVIVAAANVRSALGFYNVTGSAAARSIGVTQAYLSRRLNCEVPFDVADVILIADLLRMTPGRLLDGEPWPVQEVVVPAA